MKLYYVSVNPIKYKDDKGALIELTKEAVEAGLGGKFDGKSVDNTQVFTTEAEAIEWAKEGIKSENPEQHAVVTLEGKITEEELKKSAKVTDEERLAKIYDADGKVIKINDQYLLPANLLTVQKASFVHAHKDAKDVIFVVEKVADNKDAAPAKTSSFLDILKKLAFPVLTIGTVGTAFWYGNGVPTLLASAAKLVPAVAAIPAASLVAQIAVSAAVGLLAYGLILTGMAAVNGLSNAWKKFNRTNKEKYTDELASEVASVKALQTKLELKEDSSFVVALKDLLDKAPEAAFDDKGVFAKDEPKAGNKLALAQWEHSQLEKLVATTKDEDKATLKAEIRQGPKPTPSK